MKQWNRAKLLEFLKVNPQFFGDTNEDEQLECVKVFLEQCYFPNPVPLEYFKIIQADVQRTCPHCGKRGSDKNFSRWHFDNCKSRPNPVGEPTLKKHTPNSEPAIMPGGE